MPCVGEEWRFRDSVLFIIITNKMSTYFEKYHNQKV